MTHNRENPFYAKITKKERLSSLEIPKDTHHMELDISGSGILYEVGDCIAVLPLNEREEVLALLDRLRFSGAEKVIGRQGERALERLLLAETNLSKANKKLVSLLAEKSADPKWKQVVEDPGLLKELVQRKSALELILEAEELTISAQELSDVLLPLMPRFYSIASSQKAHPHQVHLTVAMHSYMLGEKKRVGVCSKFLLEGKEIGDTVPFYIHKHRGFTLPQDPDASVIMIGPGTGIAPFRGFLQERIATGASGKNWLFFGEWHKEHTFYYGEWLTQVEKEGKLHLDCAFSRDQEEKIYVQHLMWQKSQELYRWIEEGAYLFVCGDAERMAKDVEKTLLHILEKEAKLDEAAAKQYLKSLAKEGRYLKDVY